MNSITPLQFECAKQEKPTPLSLFSIAPMLDYTNAYYRFLARLLSPSTLLYTEMVPLGAILHGEHERHLAYHEREHPIALQIGGSDPKALGRAAQRAYSYGFDELNLNVGCPSERVAAGGFGVELFRNPSLVADCIAEMSSASDLPVTVKTRIGVDEIDHFDYLCDFVSRLTAAGMQRLIVHARMAYPSRYSPRENRSRPPLRYETVYRLKDSFPDLPIEINGDIRSLDEIKQHLKHVDSVMVGRWVYTYPEALIEIEKSLFNSNFEVDREAVIEQYLDRIEPEWRERSPSLLLRPLQGLFRGQAGSRIWRSALSLLHEKGQRSTPFSQLRNEVNAHLAELKQVETKSMREASSAAPH